jgi:hypothetical protein
MNWVQNIALLEAIRRSQAAAGAGQDHDSAV